MISNEIGTPETASQLASAGISVLPIRADGSKAPAIGSWGRFQKTIATTGELSGMFSNGRGLAVICGSVSGGLEVVDVDDADTFARFADEMELAAPGLLERLPQVETPRPGRHVYYRCELIEGNQKLARVPAQNEDGRSIPKVTIETRGEGGYVLAPGCPGGCHETGRTYVHVGGPCIADVPTITVQERASLLAVARSFNQWVDYADVQGRTEQVSNGPYHDGLSPGDDYSERATWPDILEPHGWVRSHASEDKVFWSRPGKSNGWSATTGIKSAGGTELFCCFSDNAHPFQGANGSRPCTSYSRFAAYAVLNHEGDYRAAARALADQGYGSQRGQPIDNDQQAKLMATSADPPYVAQQFNASDLGNGEHSEVHRELPKYKRITSAELDAASYETEYLIDYTLVAGQPFILAAPRKAMKTSILIDMAISLSCGGFFLGKLPVSRACRVLMMSGESGLATLQETARRIAKVAGHKLSDLSNLTWSPDLPQFGNTNHLEAFRQFITDDEIEVIILDPAYLCLPGDDAGNLFKQGAMLRGITDVCQATGATLVLAHHTRKGGKIDPFAPPELEDIAWSGFQEWARQWILLGRREKYEPGSGIHRLWLTAGGSAGHSALWGVDIAEGVFDGQSERYWSVDVIKAEEVRESATDRIDDDKLKQANERIEVDSRKVVGALVKTPGGDTKRGIRDRTGLSDARVTAAVASLLDDGEVVPCGVVKPDRRLPRDGFKLAETTTESA